MATTLGSNTVVMTEITLGDPVDSPAAPSEAHPPKSTLFDRCWRSQLIPKHPLLHLKVTWVATFGLACE